MAATTVQRLINLAFFDIGAVASGETPNNDESNDAFDLLNGMVASWSAEQLMIFNEVLQTFALNGQGAYTLGVNGTWNTAARAQRIVAWRSVSGAFNGGGPPLSFPDFAEAARQLAVSFAGVAAQVSALLAPFSIPSALLLSAAATPLVLGADTAWPLVNVRLFPAPAGAIEITYWTPIPAFAALGSEINLPPGFEEALRLNLAVLLYPQYARQSGIDPALAANAQNAKAAIAAQNTPPRQAVPQNAPPQQQQQQQ